LVLLPEEYHLAVLLNLPGFKPQEVDTVGETFRFNQDLVDPHLYLTLEILLTILPVLRLLVSVDIPECKVIIYYPGGEMKYWFLIIPIILILACGPKTEFGPNDTVTIHGKFLDEDGSPYADKMIGIWILSVEGFSVTNYWYPDPDSKDITDSAGEFEFEYKGSDLQWTSGNSKYVIIANTDSMDGPVVALGFFPVKIDEEMPTVQLWNGNPQVDVSGDTSATFTWQGIEDTHGDVPPPDRYKFKARASLYFDQYHVDSLQTKTLTLPTFIFQNVSTGWRVEAIYEAETDTGIDIVYSSTTNTQSLPSTQPDLLSKDKACYAEGLGSTQFAKITNQVWHEVGGDEAFSNTNPDYIMIDLGDTFSIAAIATYGLTPNIPSSAQHGGFEVYATSDTSSWGNPIGTTSNESGYFYLDNLSATGQYIKFEKGANSDVRIHSLKEFAVFGQ